MKECPDCAEDVKDSASACPYCSYEFAEDDPADEGADEDERPRRGRGKRRKGRGGGRRRAQAAARAQVDSAANTAVILAALGWVACAVFGIFAFFKAKEAEKIALRNDLDVPGSVTAAKWIAGIQMVILVGVLLLYAVVEFGRF